MNNKNIRSILSFVLSLVLLVSCIPCTGNAAGSADIQSIKKTTGLMIVEDYDDYIGDNWIEALALPQTVKVTLANGAEEEVLVNWDASVIDTRTTGYYSVPGEIMLPAGVENSNNLTVSITVQVCEYKNLIANPGFEENLSGWYLRGANPNPSRVESPVKDGKYAAMTGTFSSTKTESAFAELRGVEKYFPDSLSRIQEKNHWAQYTLEDDRKDTNAWWLRDKGAYDSAGLMVLEDGKYESLGGAQNIAGIRPAMWILKNYIDFVDSETPVLEGQLDLFETERN